MGIKYHQYGCGNDYGDDHYLTDNWNPDYDYGSQYVEVYFNIKILPPLDLHRMKLGMSGMLLQAK